MEKNNKKVGVVAVVGKANVGKSSLINSIVGFDVSIITPKPQTTRFNIRGIYTSETSQIVFIDTPGVHVPKTKLGMYMMKGVNIAINAVEVVLLMVDCTKPKIDEITTNTMKSLADSKHKVILCINKIDARKKEDILKIIDEYNQAFESMKTKFLDIIPISVKKQDGLDLVVKRIEKELPYGEPVYEEDEVTTMSSRDIAGEVIRGVMLNHLQEEVPHRS